MRRKFLSLDKKNGLKRFFGLKLIFSAQNEFFCSKYVFRVHGKKNRPRRRFELQKLIFTIKLRDLVRFRTLSGKFFDIGDILDRGAFLWGNECTKNRLIGSE